MRAKRVVGITAAIVGVWLAVPAGQTQRTWTTDFTWDANELASRGTNPYFILEPGYVLTLEEGKERLVITVLADTKRVMDIETRVVEERETNDGALVEVSRNY